MRQAFRALLLGVLPAWLVMRVGAQWVESEEAVGDPSWIGIGYATSEGGLLLILIATWLAWRATRRGAAGSGRARPRPLGARARRLRGRDLGDDGEAHLDSSR